MCASLWASHVIDLVDPSYMTFWGREGLMPHDAAIRGIDR